jgi:hypothetical protein
MSDIHNDIIKCLNEGVTKIEHIEEALKNRKYFQNIKRREKRRIIKKELEIIKDNKTINSEKAESIKKCYNKNKILFDKFQSDLSFLFEAKKPMTFTIIIILTSFYIISSLFNVFEFFNIIYFINITILLIYLIRHDFSEMLYKSAIIYVIYSFLSGIKSKINYLLGSSDIDVSNQYVYPEPLLLGITTFICVFFFSRQLLRCLLTLANPLFIIYSTSFMREYAFSQSTINKQVKYKNKDTLETYKNSDKISKDLKKTYTRFKANQNYTTKKATNIVLLSRKIFCFFTGRDLKNDSKSKQPSLYLEIMTISFSFAMIAPLMIFPLFKYTIYLDNKNECSNQPINSFFHTSNNKIVYLNKSSDNLDLIEDDCMDIKLKINYKMTEKEKEDGKL